MIEVINSIKVNFPSETTDRKLVSFLEDYSDPNSSIRERVAYSIIEQRPSVLPLLLDSWRSSLKWAALDYIHDKAGAISADMMHKIIDLTVAPNINLGAKRRATAILERVAITPRRDE
jgi:hypothetical protein